MTQKSNEFIPKLKYYHIILISLLFSPLLILNSNSINRKREQKKIYKENSIFLRKLYLRNLDFTSDTNKICQKGSEELQNYYKTDDGKTIDIKDNEPIKSEDSPDYIQALINLVSGEGDMTSNIKDYIVHIIPILVF